jgi:hypothetical protein
MLFASVVYAFATFGPKRAWRRALATLAAWLERTPTALHLHAAARRLAGAADEKAHGACGGCNNCGSEKSSPAERIGAAPRSDPGSSEIRVPIANIARARRTQQ